MGNNHVLCLNHAVVLALLETNYRHLKRFEVYLPTLVVFIGLKSVTRYDLRFFHFQTQGTKLLQSANEV